MKAITLGILLVTALCGCSCFQDMATHQGSYAWCTQQTQPVPACSNYGLDQYEKDEDDEQGPCWIGRIVGIARYRSPD